jgi:hypothetical protein
MHARMMDFMAYGSTFSIQDLTVAVHKAGSDYRESGEFSICKVDYSSGVE